MIFGIDLILVILELDFYIEVVGFFYFKNKWFCGFLGVIFGSND